MSKIISKVPFQLHQELVESINFTKTGFVLIGKLLYKLHENDNFTSAVGLGIDTWDDYISQPEIGLTRGEASRLMQIYEQFVLRLGLSEEEVSKIPVKNIHYLLPLVKDAPEEEADNIRALIEDAKNLSQKDFKERMWESKHESQDRSYEYLVMRRCVETGTLSRVHGIESTKIIEAFKIDETNRI